MHTIIKNAHIVLRDRCLDHGAIAIHNDIITEISADADALLPKANTYVVDAQGAHLLPGFIDTHSDHIERIIQPRPQSMIGFELALREQEKQLVNQGITTMYHSLSIADVRRKNPLRSAENMMELARMIHSMHEGEHLIRHRFHCRYDLCNLHDYDLLLQMLGEGLIHYLSFTDHTPGQGQYRDVAFFKEQVLGGGHTDEERDRILLERMTREKLTRQQMERVADLAAQKHVPIASHDDDTEEKLDYVTRNLGAAISEFPVELEIARQARHRGMQVVVGATNVLMGRSHSNNLSATTAIQEGCADILVSDYFPPSILHAVYKLYEQGILPLHEAVRMASHNPAVAMGVADQVGSIAPGQQADLLLVNRRGRIPSVESVFIAGERVSSIRYRNLDKVRMDAGYAV